MLKVIVLKSLPNQHYLVLRDNTDDIDCPMSKSYTVKNYSSEQILHDTQTHWVNDNFGLGSLVREGKWIPKLHDIFDKYPNYKIAKLEDFMTEKDL